MFYVWFLHIYYYYIGMTKQHGNTKNTPEIIESRLDKTGDCWVWTGGRDKDGYGRTSYLGKEWFVHRLMYEWYNPELEDHLVVMHTCDNPPCANPKHLKKGTHGDNFADCVKKGRRPDWKGANNPRARLTEFQVKKIR